MTESRGIAAIRSNPNWTLLILRAFLAFTFLYAGLSKIGDRSFLDKDDPSSMYATLVAVKADSPIGGLLGPVMDHSFAFGLLMSLGEVAVGLGMLLGLLTRFAAVGGILLTLSLFLTVSWGANPWYTGADIVYAFAFTPLVLAGPTPFSVDEWLARARDRSAAGDDTADRTRLLVIAGAAAVLGAVSVGIASLFRGSGSDSSADGNSGGTTATASGSGGSLVAASAVPVGGAVQTKDPKSGEAVWVLQLESGDYTAYNATCPHQQCAVSFVSKSAGFSCPCHQSKFDSAGKVTQGPATRGLTAITVSESSGQIVES